jgi:hypothetical protein
LPCVCESFLRLFPLRLAPKQAGAGCLLNNDTYDARQVSNSSNWAFGSRNRGYFFPSSTIS